MSMLVTYICACATVEIISISQKLNDKTDCTLWSVFVHRYQHQYRQEPLVSVLALVNT